MGWHRRHRHVPRCLALVPERRRQRFLAGIYRACEDETVSFDQ